MSKGDTVRLSKSVENHTCPEGRENNKTARIVSFIGSGLMLDRDLHGCRYWNKSDVIVYRKAS